MPLWLQSGVNRLMCLIPPKHHGTRNPPGVTYHEADVTVTNDWFRVVVKVDLRPNNALGEPMVLGGLIALGEKLDDPCYDFQLQVPLPIVR